MKTVAFVGLAGPFGYDYEHEAPRVNDADNSSPNPILENVLGLLICYDEVVFLARQFAPADLRNLPYVRFISDEPNLLAKALDALREYDAQQRDDFNSTPSFETFAEVSATMTQSSTERWAIDNHTHGIQLDEDNVIVGNAMDLNNAIKDLWVAATLDLNHADVILSSPAQRALDEEVEKEIARSAYFSFEKRTAANRLVAVRVPNFLMPTGSYHEGLEAIRERKDVREFRQFLLTYDAPIEDGLKLASEIENAAFDAVDQLTQRFLNGRALFRSIGVPLVSGVLNGVQPPIGTLVGTLAQAPFELADRKFKAVRRWAPFVVALSKGRLLP